MRSPLRVLARSPRPSRLARLGATAGCVASLAAGLIAPVAASASTAASAPVARHAAPRCTTSGALFSRLPFSPSPKGYYTQNDFAQYTANRGSSYAGIAYRGASDDFYLISSRTGGSNPSVLAKFHFRYAHAVPYAVNAVGISPSGQVVASVQNPNFRAGKLAFGAYQGMYWTGRTAHYLAHQPGWIAYNPSMVTNSGMIVGYAATGSQDNPHYWVVTWASTSAPAQVVADAGTLRPGIWASGDGGLSWPAANGTTMVRTPDGVVHKMTMNGSSQFIFPAGASNNGVFAASQSGIVRWTAASLQSDGTMAGSMMSHSSAAAAYIDTVGPNGEVVAGSSTARLMLPSGAWATMPSQALLAPVRSRVIDSAGRVAFTSSRDRRVHFFSCH